MVAEAISAAMSSSSKGNLPASEEPVPDWHRKWKRHNGIRLTGKIAREVVNRALKATGKGMKRLTRADIQAHGCSGQWALKEAGGRYRLLRKAGYRFMPWEIGRVPRGYWELSGNRKRALRWASRRLSKPVERLSGPELHRLGLAGLAFRPKRELMRDSGLPSWMALTHRRWKVRDNRIAATRWLIEKTGKPGIELSRRDFERYGLASLHGMYFPAGLKLAFPGKDGAPARRRLLAIHMPALRAAAEAGRLGGSDGWAERKCRKYGTRERRVAVVRRVLAGTGKKPRFLTGKDFVRAGHYFLISRYYRWDVSRALRETGLKISKRDMVKVFPHAKWKTSAARARAIREFVESSGRPPKELTAKDLCRAGRGSLLTYKSFAGLLREAGYDIQPWELKHVSHSFWMRRRNRAGAVRWLIRKTGKRPSNLKCGDFSYYDLGGLWQHVGKKTRKYCDVRVDKPYYSIYTLLKDAGFKGEAERALYGRKLKRRGKFRHRTIGGRKKIPK